LFFDASHWDVYALAMILWSLWFRRDPWPRAFSAHKIMGMVTRGRRPPLDAASDAAASVASAAPLAAPLAAAALPGGFGGGEGLLPPHVDAFAQSIPAGGSAPGDRLSSSISSTSAPSSFSRSISSSIKSASGTVSSWGDLSSALPPPPALRRLIARMWSHGHHDRPELPVVMDIFAREVTTMAQLRREHRAQIRRRTSCCAKSMRETPASKFFSSPPSTVLSFLHGRARRAEHR
jgi:hypothetical protein